MSYDDWKTIDPREFYEPEAPEWCEDCGNFDPNCTCPKPERPQVIIHLSETAECPF